MIGVPYGKLILRIDASAMQHSQCMRRFLLTTLHGYTSKLDKIELQFGNAVHKFYEAFLKGGATQESLHAAMHYTHNWYKEALARTEENKNKVYLTDPLYLTKACMNLATDYTEGLLSKMKVVTVDDYGPLVEMKFAIPLVDNPRHSILLCGTLDGIYQVQPNGSYVIADLKTTSTRDTTRYFDSYRMSTQLMTYYYAMQNYANANPGSIFAEIASKGIGIRIIALLTNGSSEEPGVMLSPVYYFKDALYHEYAVSLLKFAERLSNILHLHGNEAYPYMHPREGIALNACQHWSGNCPFFGPCSSPDEKSFEALLNSEFTKREYDPLKFR